MATTYSQYLQYDDHYLLWPSLTMATPYYGHHLCWQLYKDSFVPAWLLSLPCDAVAVPSAEFHMAGAFKRAEYM